METPILISPPGKPKNYKLVANDGVEITLCDDDIRLIEAALNIKAMLNLGHISNATLELPLDYKTHYNTESWHDWLLTLDVIKQLISGFTINEARDSFPLSADDPRVIPPCKQAIRLRDLFAALRSKRVVESGLG